MDDLSGKDVTEARRDERPQIDLGITCRQEAEKPLPRGASGSNLIQPPGLAAFSLPPRVCTIMDEGHKRRR